MRIRVTSPHAKFVTLFIGVVTVLLAGVAIASFSFNAGYLVATALAVVLVVTAARTFRGYAEPPEPRPWWQMAATPAAAFVLGILFLLQASGTMIQLLVGRADPVVWVGVIVGLMLSAAYAHSAIRQARQRTRSGHGTT